MLQKSLAPPLSCCRRSNRCCTRSNPSLLQYQIGRITTMSDGRFSDYIARERERLSGEREEIAAQKRELDNRIAAIDREFQALDAYQATKTGKPSRGRRTRTQGQARRGSRREELLNLIRGGNGLSRGDILERIGLKGDKSGEMSVSNALAALSKSNQVRREGGKYYLTPTTDKPEDVCC